MAGLPGLRLGHRVDAAGDLATTRHESRIGHEKDKTAYRRERSDFASTAWTVSDIETRDPKVLGVVVSNSSGSTFHDVVITVKIDGSRVPRPISLKILPPGTYFVAYAPKAKFVWDFPLPIEACTGVLQPYMNTDGYQIESIDFADNLNQRWSTDARAVLTAR